LVCRGFPPPPERRDERGVRSRFRTVLYEERAVSNEIAL
jgi:hypothetical protein